MKQKLKRIILCTVLICYISPILANAAPIQPISVVSPEIKYMRKGDVCNAVNTLLNGQGFAYDKMDEVNNMPSSDEFFDTVFIGLYNDYLTQKPNGDIYNPHASATYKYAADIFSSILGMGMYDTVITDHNANDKIKSEDFESLLQQIVPNIIELKQHDNEYIAKDDQGNRYQLEGDTYLIDNSSYFKNNQACMLSDIVIDGNLIITEGINFFDYVVLNNITVTGKLIIRGGGQENTILIKGDCDIPNIFIHPINPEVKINIEKPFVKDTDDIKELNRIASQQINVGAKISDHPDSVQYSWDPESGKLIGINWAFLNINNAIDIHGFSALKEFTCIENPKLNTIKANGLTELTKLDCHFNSLSVLEIDGCTSLSELICRNNAIKTLDLSSNTNLFYVDCSDNRLSELTLGNLDQMDYLYCGYNILSSIDVSKLNHLRYLNCESNEITQLDIRGLEKLEKLDCKMNILSKLLLHNNDNLTILECSYNELTSLNASDLKALSNLSCSYNRLEKLSLTGLSLTELSCSNNRLTELDLSGMSKLKGLYFMNNNLTNLDLSDLSSLETLRFIENQIKAIDIRGLKHLTEKNIYCDDDVVIIQ